jgi:C4-dicarboxylate-binding protein DctP
LRSGFAFACASLLAASALAQGQSVRIGNVTAGDVQAASCDKFAELITKYSNGKLAATAHQGGSLGNNQQMIRGLQAGSVHGMVFPAGFLSAVVPDLGMFDLPFLLPGSPSAITKFTAQSKAAEVMKDEAAKKGILIIGFVGVGAQNLLTRFPVNQLSDLVGKKMRVIPSPPRMGAYQDWGAVARPMELGEVYTALQQGTLDGIENPPDVIYKMKLHEAAQYYIITEHNAFVANVIVSKSWFDGLSKDLKDAVGHAGRETVDFTEVAYTNAQNTSLEALRKAVKVSAMPPTELAKMKEQALNGVWKRMENDPARGQLVKMLREDVSRFMQK